MPLTLKLPKVFYGWWIVIASLLLALYAGGVVFYGFTAVFEPIADDFGWSHTQISLAASLRGLEMGLFAPIIGALIDRWGPRRLIFVGALITAAGLFLLSQTSSLAMFYGAFVLVSIGMSCSSMTVLMTSVANWFHRKVGLASGIAVSGFGLGGLLVPVMVKLIDTYDWRRALMILSAGMLVVILPLSFVFRHRPEQYGYSPDGAPSGPTTVDNDTSGEPFTEVNIKAKQALKSNSFWRMAIAFTVHVLLVNTAVVHVMPYLSSINITRATSSIVATAIPLSSVGGRLGLGWLGDKTNRKRIATAAFTMMGLGILCFAYVSSTAIWLIVPFLILFGVGYGGVNALRPSLVREYFGRANFGTVFGLLIGVNMIGSVIGPILGGWVYDTWQNYQGLWLALATLPIAALFSVLTLHPVRVKANAD